MNLRQVLQAELITAMKNQDKASMMAIRSVLSAIANKQAVPAPAAGSIDDPVLGYPDVPRRELTPAEVRLVVMDEVDERRNSADYLTTAGKHEEAAALQNQVEILERFLYLT
ncbi:hypothetical protein BH23ACT12_BH23ACT12_20510 [soil metagenome]